MTKKLKLLLAALLGFSGACSTVKNAPQGSNPERPAGVQPASGDSLRLRRIVLMYGVRPPVGELKPAEGQPRHDSVRKPINRHPARFEVDPVTEESKD